MALRLTGKFYTLDSEYVWIEIYDNDLGTPSSNEMTIDNAVLSRIGGEDSAFANVFTASLDITIRIKDANIQSFIDDVQGASDKRFFVKVKRNYVVAVPPDPLDTYDEAFNGVLITDNFKIDNIWQPPVQLKFVDGLSLIADNEYRPTSTTYYDTTTYETLVGHMLNILNLTPTADYHSNPILSTNWNWYESTHSSIGAVGSFDPLDKTRVSHHAFTEYDGGHTNLVTMPIKDVLNSILTITDTRLWYDTNYAIYRWCGRHQLGTATLDSWTYTKAGSQNSETGVVQLTTVTTPDDELMSGGQFGLYPPIKKVFLEYIYNDKTGLFLPNWDSDTSSSLAVVGTIKIVSSTTRLAIVGNLYHNSVLLPAQQWVNHKMKFRFTIKLERVTDGQIYYYRSSDNSFTETLSYFEVYSELIEEGDNGTFKTREIFIETQQLEDAIGGASDFQIDDFIKVWLLFEYVSDVPDTTGVMGHDWYLHGSESYTNELPLNNDYKTIKEEYYGVVSEDNNYIVKKSTNLGDTVRVNTIERLEVTDGTDWFMSYDWAIGAFTGGNRIQELVILDIIKSQRLSIRTYEGGTINGINKLGVGIVYDSSSWIPLAGQEDLKKSEVSQTYYEYKSFAGSTTLGQVNQVESSNGSSSGSSGGGSTIPVQSPIVFIPYTFTGSGTTLAVSDLPNPDNLSDPENDIHAYLRVVVSGVEVDFESTLTTPYGYTITSGVTELTFGRDITGEKVKILITQI